MNQQLSSNIPYSVLNVGVGLGYEVRMPLAYLRDSSKHRAVHYTATNLDTIPRYEDPPAELRGDIEYLYHEGFLLEESVKETQSHLFLASRVGEWANDPTLWFQAAYDALLPGGIAIIHSIANIRGQDPIELAKQAGFERGNIGVRFDLDKYSPVLCMLLYKNLGREGGEYPDWLHRLNKQSNFFYYVEDMNGPRFSNALFPPHGM